ncbi:hypothetical protein LEP48_07965 [Isoptericola sp. NEAU-Y5]|uniref:Adhesin domain-containing protein n=1 Tax=Isoptericola luteus TaxID=2879484 RepID=A0ABS7ZE31_9MICO|nr:hypothetical protein [Isoptericola sp. NEAU-Y5]MCA5893294.1 hypothetical protein [Isoptericola sp. NEAU-Y5]
MTSPDLVPLGPAPRPTTGDDLAARLIDLARQAGGGTVTGLERARVTADLDGADVAALELDLTGVAFGAGQQAPGASWSPVSVSSREPGTVRRLRVDAHPLTAVDLPVDVTAEAAGLRLAWVEGSDGQVGVEAVEPDDAHPVTGHARVAVSRAGLVATVHGLLAVSLQSQGIQLTGLDVRLDPRGPRAAGVRIDAKIRKGFLSAAVTATASAAVDDAMVLTVGDVQISSGNPLVSAMLGAVRGRVEAAANRRVDLAAALPSGVHLTDVRLDVGEELVISARLG